jgi:hypothetical protein
MSYLDDHIADLRPEDAARPGTTDDPIAWRLNKHQLEAIDARADIICEVGYNRGVADAREHFKNPSHVVGYTKGGFRKADEPAVAATHSSIPNPGDLAARARAIQIEGEKSGKNISNIEAVKMAYEEANIPWR